MDTFSAAERSSIMRRVKSRNTTPGRRGQERVKKSKSGFSELRKTSDASQIVAHIVLYCVFFWDEPTRVPASQFFHRFQTGRSLSYLAASHLLWAICRYCTILFPLADVRYTHASSLVTKFRHFSSFNLL